MDNTGTRLLSLPCEGELKITIRVIEELLQNGTRIEHFCTGPENDDMAWRVEAYTGQVLAQGETCADALRNLIKRYEAEQCWQREGIE